jgi:hypothetical protein
VSLRRCTTALNAVLVAAMAWPGVSGAATPARKMSPPASKSQAAETCFRDATTPPRPIPLPTPTRLLNTISLQWNSSIVLAPPPAVLARGLKSPSSIWTGLTAAAGSHSQLILAYFSASIPATLAPGGAVLPSAHHVLAWILLTQHLPFDGAFISPPAGVTLPDTCAFVGQDIAARNAATGAALQGGGFHVPSHGSVIRPDVTPWAVAQPAIRVLSPPPDLKPRAASLGPHSSRR